METQEESPAVTDAQQVLPHETDMTSSEQDENQTMKVVKKPKLASFQENDLEYEDEYDEPWPTKVPIESNIDSENRNQSLKPDGASVKQQEVMESAPLDEEDNTEKQDIVLNIQKHGDDHDDLGIYDDTAVCDDLSDTEIGEGPETQRDELVESVAEKTDIPEISVLDNTDDPQEPQPLNSDPPVEGFDLDNLDQPVPDDIDMPPHVSWVPYKKHLTAKHGQNRLYSELSNNTGLRGKANTPASLMTDYLGSQFSMDPSVETSRNASRVASESREAMFRRAMTLLSARCTSVVPGVETPYGATSRGQGSFGGQFSQYFYVNQIKPKPNIAPLKAWNGYNGNVYFEPIHISQASASYTPADTPGKVGSRNFQQLVSQKVNRPDSNNTHTRTLSRATNKSSIKSGKTMSTRQMVMLDKRAVLNRFNKNLQQELDWLEGQESTGSLAVRPKSDPVKQTNREQTVYNKEKICKGSMAHKLSLANRESNPTLKVSGDKFSSPTLMSPLLRTQTQYTLSNRLTTNSPDLFHPLPPLEQLRATVRHMDNVSNPNVKTSNYRQNRPVTDELKPFIKYSPDVKPKMQTSLG